LPKLVTVLNMAAMFGSVGPASVFKDFQVASQGTPVRSQERHLQFSARHTV
jgi:hypothetical protein